MNKEKRPVYVVISDLDTKVVLFPRLIAAERHVDQLMKKDGAKKSRLALLETRLSNAELSHFMDHSTDEKLTELHSVISQALDERKKL